MPIVHKRKKIVVQKKVKEKKKGKNYAKIYINCKKIHN